MTVNVKNPSMQDAYAHADRLLARMTLREKIGQMTQAEKGSVTPAEVRDHGLGSVLSGGGGNPDPNTPEAWRSMATSFVDASRDSRLGVPILYGVDAVHGHNNMVGATVFPHNIGLGAAGDEDLLERIGRVTALEVTATGVRWDFAPAVSIPLDVRWGRTYEGYGQDTDLVSRLAAAYVRGLRGRDWSEPDSVLPSVKHFVADGASAYGSSTRLERMAVDEDQTLANAGTDDAMQRLIALGAWTMDQGASEGSDAWLRQVALPPYAAAIAEGALNVMASYSAWNGVRMHVHHDLLQGVLKGEMGFEGFVVSDWEGVEMAHEDYDTAVANSINAGVDMSMVPFDWRRFMDTLERLVEQGRVAESRIDDAARRILAVKARLGLLNSANALPDLSVVRSPAHRELAREAAASSQVLLRNQGDLLPLASGTPSMLVAGQAADDVGLNCGGWTVTWMGSPGATVPGTTPLEGIRAHAGEAAVQFEADAQGDATAEIGIVFVHEEPYAEGMGDRHSLQLGEAQQAIVRRVRARTDKLVLIVVSGRPIVLGEAETHADAVVAAWLPGSEAAGVADPLFGRTPYRGVLRYEWPASDDDLPLHPFGGGGEGRAIWRIGDGVTTRL